MAAGRVIQHEMDHLIGKLFVDYLSPLKRDMVRKSWKKQRRPPNLSAPAPDRCLHAAPGVRGTPEFASALHACLRPDCDVVAVYTQPDRPAGRGRKLSPPAVKQAALAAGIEVRQPESLRRVEARRELAALAPDLMIVVAYGLILSPSVLAIPRHGC